MNCTALGYGTQVSQGPCKDDLTLDLAIKLMEQAIDDAEAKATATCPPNCKCVGTATPLGPPTCSSFHLGEVQYHIWIVTAAFDGDCDCGGGQVVKEIESSDFRDFFQKVSKLPKLPEDPKGPCQMYQQQHGHGFSYPVCAGTCANGNCRTIINVRGKRVTAKCDCR